MALLTRWGSKPLSKGSFSAGPGNRAAKRGRELCGLTLDDRIQGNSRAQAPPSNTAPTWRHQGAVCNRSCHLSRSDAKFWRHLSTVASSTGRDGAATGTCHLRYIHRHVPNPERSRPHHPQALLDTASALLGAEDSQEDGHTLRGGGGGSGPDDEAEEGLAARGAMMKTLRALSAGDVLHQKRLLRQQLEVKGNCTVNEAIDAMVNQKVNSFLVINRKQSVIGMFTARDLLGVLAKHPNKADALQVKAYEFMIPLNQMVYCSPADNLYQCLLIMSELKIRNLPVVSDGQISGIVNINDISDYSFSMEELGGKGSYIKNISERKGLPKGVSLGQRPADQPDVHMSASVGSYALPHPFKQVGQVSASRREHRHLDFASDPTLSEDAHFILSLPWTTQFTDTVHYVGIADGVGSWRSVGVDPRDFSHRLMHWAQEYIMSAMAAAAPAPGPDATGSDAMMKPPPRPNQVLSAAWEMTVGEKVVGSSTACIAALDYELDQLTFSNIGDNGVVILRHIDSDVAGYMREKQTPRHLRTSDLRMAFISQQQLRSFNLPYQFGYTNIEDDQSHFETPRDAVNTSFPVMAGDIIIVATDGLYDNMELDELCSLALDWEIKWFGGPLRGLDAHNNAAMADLAETLSKRARDLSVDETRDSPFALLAKENDIMWGGGMPDDITVVAMRVIRKNAAAMASAEDGGDASPDYPIAAPEQGAHLGALAMA